MITILAHVSICGCGPQLPGTHRVQEYLLNQGVSCHSIEWSLNGLIIILLRYTRYTGQLHPYWNTYTMWSFQLLGQFFFDIICCVRHCSGLIWCRNSTVLFFAVKSFKLNFHQHMGGLGYTFRMMSRQKGNPGYPPSLGIPSCLQTKTLEGCMCTGDYCDRFTVWYGVADGVQCHHKYYCGVPGRPKVTSPQPVL